MFPHILDSFPSLAHLGCIDAEECAELLEGDIVVELGGGQHVVLDDRALEHLGTTCWVPAGVGRLGARAGWAPAGLQAGVAG